MSTVTIPPVLTSPRDDAMQLYRAFKGVLTREADLNKTTLSHVVLDCLPKGGDECAFDLSRDHSIKPILGEVYKISLLMTLKLCGGFSTILFLLGFGCDTAAVINVLAHRDATQRALIQHEYRATYSEDLNKRLSSELSGDLKRAVLLWMHDPAGRDATIVRQALSGNVIDLKAATEVLCSRTPSQIQQLRQLLLAYVTTPRYEGPEVDRMAVEKDAKALFKAGEKRLGTDEKTFRSIFSERSRAHLAAVSAAYHNMYGNSLKKVLRKAMKGMGTDDTTLTRVIVTRAEIDMQYIKAEYHKKHRKSLNDDVHSETSSHFRTFLLSLLGPTHH
ncbi:hypothetical protein RJ640_010108 [Escallonia rubra]|uniref:Annexin n=1 Tax=Escallonia rubra TaxID=112253 RepID=A0AA88RHM7_9ASTE|nr:hypothetical protein RJ640_010108 [Escallonia rubra]